MSVSASAKPLAALLCCIVVSGTATSVFAQDFGANHTRSDVVIVTANKREEPLQDVPTAVAVIDAAQLRRQNITDVLDLTRAAAALNGGYDPTASVLSIRGIGTSSFSFTSEGSVAVVLDGVALANTSELAPQLLDIERVEVLEGPQGTLYGRNASAGVINVVSAQPVLDETSFSGRAQAGSRHGSHLHGVLNLPLLPTAALRIAVAHTQRERTVRNLNGGGFDQAKSVSGRARLKIDAGGAATLLLNADYNRRRRGGGASSAVYRTTDPASTTAVLLAACGVAVDDENTASCADGADRTATDNYGFSGQLEWNLGRATLTSISAYRHLRTDGTIDVDDLPINIVNRGATSSRYRNISQEIRLASPTGLPLEYVVGGYWLSSSQDHGTTLAGQVLSLLLPPSIPTSRLEFGRSSATDVSSSGVAAFGQMSIGVTDRLKLLGGFRVGREHLHASTRRTVAPGAFATFPPQLGEIGDLTPHDTRRNDAYYSYKLGGSYLLAGDVRAYLTFTRGYKGAAINDSGSGNVVDPEVPRSWEGGVKAALLGGRMVLGLSAFHTSVRNFQTIVYDQATNSFDFANAPRLTSSGATLTVKGRLSDRVSFTGGLAYTNARYGPGFIVRCAPAQTEATGCETFRAPDGTTFTGDEVRGNRVPGSPKWKITLSGDISLPASDRLAIFVQPDLVYTSAIRFSQAFDPNRVTGSRAIMGGRFGLRSYAGKPSLSLYVRNLFDVRFPTFRAPLATNGLTNDPLTYQQAFATESFRTVGLTLDFDL